MSKCDSHLRQNDRGFVAGADGNLGEKQVKRNMQRSGPHAD